MIVPFPLTLLHQTLKKQKKPAFYQTRKPIPMPEII
jgi:hypothetical protein